jgi:cytochrome P450
MTTTSVATAGGKATQLPPGPPSVPIIGHLLELQRDQLGFLTRCARQYGDVVPLRFGTNLVVLLNHPTDIEDVLAKKNRSFTKGRYYRLLRPLLGNGLFTSEGAFWLRQRRLAQPAFHRDRIAGYARTMVEFTEDMLDGWTVGTRRDVNADMMQLTLRVVGKALFDADVVAESHEMGAALATALHALNPEINGLGLIVPPGWVTPGRLRLRAAVKRLDRIVFGIVGERRQTGEDRGDLLAMLLGAQDEDGSRMTDQQVRDEAMTIVLAGHETSALALSWLWFLLATHPEQESALHEELDRVLGQRPPRLEDIPQLEYTEMAVREALRLYPPALEFGRETIQEVEIGGFRLPPATNVMFLPYIVQRDPRWFEDPDSFRPERWADGLAQRLARFAYFPFSGGPRICIGQSFAMMEAVLLAAAIAQRFRLVLDPGTQVRADPALTLRIKGGLPMRIEARSSPPFP